MGFIHGKSIQLKLNLIYLRLSLIRFLKLLHNSKVAKKQLIGIVFGIGLN
ncbi:hypothetical protein K661_01672 [Piscirickettsia salmonis LF-89 = ATCC VR-1361]|nr:hypothetical protein K661_01672 [Piscirickettsia salmonis LF-89 = ATCC VR-1361]